MTIAFRPLAEVKMMLEETGNDVSYAYDDLVFVAHTAFLIQFDDTSPKNLKLFFNAEIDELESIALEKQLGSAAKKRTFNLVNSGYFKMKQKEEAEELELVFFPKK
jgi:hypothetical protein